MGLCQFIQSYKNSGDLYWWKWFLLGRGNQQISPRVIRKVGKEQIEIVATKEKLAGLGGQPMHVDTGDADADEYLKGYYKIIFKNSDSAIYKVG